MNTRREGLARMSPDGLHRLWLTRSWGVEGRIGRGVGDLLWVMLNPSTADAEIDDPTIGRIRSFSECNGYASCTVVNLYTRRTSCPDILFALPRAKRNDAEAWPVLRSMLAQSDRAVAAWGTRGDEDGRATWLRTALPWIDWMSLGQDVDGSPPHPLYVPGCTKLEKWPAVPTYKGFKVEPVNPIGDHGSVWLKVALVGGPLDGEVETVLKADALGKAIVVPIPPRLVPYEWTQGFPPVCYTATYERRPFRYQREGEMVQWCEWHHVADGGKS